MPRGKRERRPSNRSAAQPQSISCIVEVRGISSSSQRLCIVHCIELHCSYMGIKRVLYRYATHRHRHRHRHRSTHIVVVVVLFTMRANQSRTKSRELKTPSIPHFCQCTFAHLHIQTIELSVPLISLSYNTRKRR